MIRRTLTRPPDPSTVVDLVHQLYPDDCYVTTDAIIGWAHDRMVDACVDDYVKAHGLIPDDAAGEALYEKLALSVVRPALEDAKAFLEDLGLHTFAAERACGVALNRMADKLRPHVRACWPKEQHRSPGAAQAQLRSITRRGLAKNEATIRVYVCHQCKFEDGSPVYHVGHRRA